MSLRKQTPSDFLKQIIGRPVVVKLNSGVDYRGVLACLDGYMNIAVEQTEEYVNGQLKNKYGDAFLRGNNVASMHSKCLVDARGQRRMGRLIQADRKMPCYHCAGWWWWCNSVGDVFLAHFRPLSAHWASFKCHGLPEHCF
ncbi:LSM6 protein, partial [Amia calva]|nr:LSM6 protein [Amia calva]